MKKIAHIQDGKVVNISVWQHLPQLDNVVDVTDTPGVSIGWLYNAQDGFSPPALAVLATPTVVTMRQARLALLQADKLGDINLLVQQLGSAAQIEWEYAQTVERSHPLVQALGMSNGDLDELFLVASQL